MAVTPLSWPGDGATAPPFHPDQPWAETASLQAGGGWFGASAPQLGQLLPEAYAGHDGVPERCNTNTFGSQGINLRFITSTGTYGIGDSIDISVAPVNSAHRFGGKSAAHWIRDTILVMETGAVDRNATYYSQTPGDSHASSLTSIIYRYTVQVNDTSDRLDYIDSSNSLWWGDPTSPHGANIARN